MCRIAGALLGASMLVGIIAPVASAAPDPAVASGAEGLSPVYGPYFGVMGSASAMVFSALDAAYGSASGSQYAPMPGAG
ncbi:hypothetical protein AQI95_40915 [Streptomyces yokosukanensis]|uniref:Uncharacterized protein n=1 Tax=Streptomyces yokosukanensis TaxID=67386 RepID=A0A101NTI6_9ACTN|nr:hypothetical protein AQI95_40915 [Streptomyces yokosukanensis]